MKEELRRGMYILLAILSPALLLFGPLLLIVWKTHMPRRYADIMFIMMVYTWVVSPWWDNLLKKLGRKYRGEE